MGTGWGLSGTFRGSRCPGLRKYGAIAAPIQWNANDSYRLDGEPLVPDSDHVYYYKFHFDGSRLQFDGTSWQMQTRSGETITFGGTADSKLTTTPAPMTWAMSRIQDRAGNFMTVSYETPTGETYVRRRSTTRIDRVPDATTLGHVHVRDDGPARCRSAHGRGTFVHFVLSAESVAMHAPNSANPRSATHVLGRLHDSPVTGRSLLKYIAECDAKAPASLPVTGSTPLCRQQTFTYTPGIAIGGYGAYDGGTVTDSQNMAIWTSRMSVRRAFRRTCTSSTSMAMVGMTCSTRRAMARMAPAPLAGERVRSRDPHRHSGRDHGWLAASVSTVRPRPLSSTSTTMAMRTYS